MIFNIIGYILLPFIIIYRWISNSVKEMGEVGQIIFYIMLLIVALQIIELLTFL